MVCSTAEWTRLALLFVSGLAIGLHFAPMGFMPLDQSICFDGGWRWLSGERPFSGYLAPNGFPVHALQAMFFALFGVNWFAYCLHAAVFNGLSTVLAARWLERHGLSAAWSSVFALCTAFMFFPPFGVPYMDSHAFFFSLTALTLAREAVEARQTRSSRVLWWSSGAAMVIALLCKQIPSLFFGPFLLGIAIWDSRGATRAIGQLTAGAALTLAVTVLPLALTATDFVDTVRTYWLELPSEEGRRRLGYVPGVMEILRRFEETRVQLGLWSITAIHVIGVPGAIAALVYARRAWRQREWTWSRALGAALSAELLLLACLMFIALTGNDKEIGVPLVFASSGLAAAASMHAAKAFGARGVWVGHAAVAVFAALAVRDTWTFSRTVLETRKVNDMTFDAELARKSEGELPEGLGFLRWSVPKLVKYSPNDLRELVDYLEAREGGFFLVGDASVLYGIVGKPSILPTLWFHPGLTFPSSIDPRFAHFEECLLARFDTHDVRTIVIEPRVWIGDIPAGRLITLDVFPRVQERVDARKLHERDIGAFHVIELAAP